MIKFKRKRFLARMQARFIFVTILLTVLLIVLIGRILYIDQKDGKRYEKIVLAQQSYDSIEIPYRRGDILDCNGTQLATSEKVYNLIIEPKNVLQSDKVKEATVSALTEHFDLSEKEINEALKDDSSLYKKMLKQLPYERVEPFKDLVQSKDGKNIKGVWFEEEYERYYPYGSLACHAIGFTVSGNVGQGGIEGYYSSDLNGVNGREYGYLTEDMSIKRTTKEPTNGYNVVSTIDANAQKMVEEVINNFMTQTGAKNVSVLVMNPKTGEILSMANSNKFDLNEPYENSAIAYQFNSEDGDIDTQIKNLSDEEKLDCLNAAWRNFIISDGFEPGSTYKTFTVAGALEEGVLTGNEVFYCGGIQKVADWDIKCHNHEGHGQVTVPEALMKSCNVALMQIADAEGRTIFSKYQSDFGFGKTTGVDLYGEAGGLVYDESGLNPVELATSSFGQGLTVTMMQIGAAFCSVINGGDYYEPHVVKQIVNENGGVVTNIEPTILRKTISADTSEFMRDALYQVVESGTAQKAKVAGYTIGGKTGTAEKLPRGNGKYLLSFIGFAPVDDPELVVYVTVDEPNVEDQASSGLGTIIAQSVFEKLLPYMNIYRTDDGISEGDPSVGDELATPIYEGAIPEENITTEEGATPDTPSSEEATPEASQEQQTQEATTEAPALDTTTQESTPQEVTTEAPTDPGVG